MGAAGPSNRTIWTLVGLTAAIGLALRGWVASSGGLWLDEAWSLVMAGGVPLITGVFANIHHDNNHHLTTLWLQLLGDQAPPVLQRGLSILCGTASIGVAALIGQRRSGWVAVAMAALFAISPFFVLYGSEARGYAPVTLAILTMLWLLQRPDPSTRALVWTALLGTLSHLVMLPAILLLGAVRWLDGVGGAGPVEATRRTARIMVAPILAAALVAAIIFGAAWAGQGGMTIGGYEAYAFAGVKGALVELIRLVTGSGPYWAVLIVALLCASTWPSLRGVAGFTVLIAAMPLAVLLLHPGNTHFSRYFLISGIGLLLLLGDRIGTMLENGGWRRAAAVAAIVLFGLGSVVQIRALASDGRGRIDLAVAAMQAAHPGPTTVIVGGARDMAPLRVAALRIGYPLTIIPQDCSKADAFFVVRETGMAAKPVSNWCGRAWRLIAARDSAGPSGQSWSLYAPDTAPGR